MTAIVALVAWAALPRRRGASRSQPATTTPPASSPIAAATRTNRPNARSSGHLADIGAPARSRVGSRGARFTLRTSCCRNPGLSISL